VQERFPAVRVVTKMGPATLREPAMNKDEEYRQQAEHAEHEAQRAFNNIDREAWLRIAEEWRSLLRKHPQSEAESPK
jgi:hypothetical protein